MMNTSLSIFFCIEYNGKSYLRSDTSLMCNENIGLGIGFFFTILWAGVFPFAVFYTIYKRRNELNSDHNLSMFGIFYIGLTDQTFYWEILVMNMRKLTLIIISTFFNKDKQSLRVRFAFFKFYRVILAYSSCSLKDTSLIILHLLLILGSTTLSIYQASPLYFFTITSI
jgi:hypothetical protein